MKHFAIIYDSKTGTTKQAADWIAEGMQATGDADAKCFSIQDIDLAFVRDASSAARSRRSSTSTAAAKRRSASS